MALWDALEWFEIILAAAKDAEQFDRDPERAGRETTKEAGGVRGDRFPFVVHRYVIGEEDISLFVRAGPTVLPELIRHVHDQRWTPWCFHYPLSSGIDLQGMEVGKLACYMIEAVLRKNPYFTKTAGLDYASPPGLTEDERDRYALEQAAASYERWYEKCLDEESRTITCPETELPAVNWDYDLDAWADYLAVREHPPTGSRLQIDSSDALARAEVFACEEGLIPYKIAAWTMLNAYGEWTVSFEFAPYYAPDGRVLEDPWRWSLLAIVYPGGDCYLITFDATSRRECQAGQCFESIDEATAIELADSCAVQLGRLPTPMREEVEPQRDGGWLVTFTPGKYLFRNDGGDLNTSDYETVVVAVSQGGECSLVSATPVLH